MNPIRLDPTRTTFLRRKFSADLRRRFLQLRKEIFHLVVTQDAFGMNEKPRFIFNEEYKYASTQVNLRGWAREAVLRMASQIKAKDLADRGREHEPHITVRYGLFDADRERAEALISMHPKVKASLGKISLFKNPEYDVVKIEVESTGLGLLNASLAELPHVQTQPGYSPHITIAYVKPGCGDKYLHLNDLEGTELEFDRVIFSSTDKLRTSKLGGGLVVNDRWRFLSLPQKISEFRRWLGGRISALVLTTSEENPEDTWLGQYINEAYAKGKSRAFDDTRYKEKLQKQKMGFYEGSRYEFLRSAFGRPVQTQRVKAIIGRSYTDLKGVTDAMNQQITRTLVDGMIQGDSPRVVAKNMVDRVDKIGITRALAIAQTEIVAAHSEGQLDSFEQLGIEAVGVSVEWMTAAGPNATEAEMKRARVCPKCISLSGVVLSIDEARGLLPRHVHCKCTWTPSGVGESNPQQKKTRARIQQAIKQSIGKSKEAWGSGVKISKVRPRSLV